MPEPTAQTVLDEMKIAHQALTEHVDKQIDELRTSGQESGDHKEVIDKINGDISEIRKQYDTLITKSQQPPGETASSNGKTDEEKELENRAFEKFLRWGKGEKGLSKMTPEEVRALSGSSDADGDALVPDAFETEIIMKAFDFSEVRPIANVGITGRDFVAQASIDKPIMAWGNRNLDVPQQDLNSGGSRLEIHDLVGLVLVHNNTLEDAEADIFAELSTPFAMAIDEMEDIAWSTGSGAGEPEGFQTNAAVQANVTNTGLAAALGDGTLANNGIDPLITSMQKLKRTYRRNSWWVFNSLTEGEIRKLKDLDGAYYWQPPVQAGMPATLLGKPIAISEGMPDVAANSFPIICADFFSGYKIRDRRGMTVQRLTERYAEKRQTGFLVTRRTGGQVILSEAFQSIKVAV